MRIDAAVEGEEPDSVDAPAGIPRRVVTEVAFVLVEVLGDIDINDHAMLAAYDEVVAAAATNDRGFWASAEALGVEPGVAMYALMQANALVQLASGRDAGDGAWYVASMIQISSFPPGADTDLLRAVADAVVPFVDATDEDDPGDAEEAGDRLIDLGLLVEARGLRSRAVRVALVAMNLMPVRAGRFGEAVALAKRSLAHAGPLERAVALFRGAQFAAQSATTAAERVESLDCATVAVAAAAALSPDVLADLAPSLDVFPDLRSVATVARVVRDPDAPEEAVRAARGFLENVADLELDEFVTRLSLAWTLTAEVENARLALDPPADERIAETSWRTFALRHPAFARSVPDSSSITRTSEADELALVLAHEVTHVLCMASSIGLALLALRTAALDRELVLWTFLPDAGEVATRPAPLQEGQILALAEAEQGLEIAAKARVLQAVWTPWFEGLAMFVELCADPVDDEATSMVTDVISNLVDVFPTQDASEPEDVWATYSTALEAAERRYAGAMRRIGRDRLRAYLDTDIDRYLPGYLMVRSIVSAWRTSVVAPLSGSEASRILLSLTRQGTAEAIPDLSLPLAAFAAEAEQRARSWLRQLPLISAANLRAALENYQRDETAAAGRWKNGSYEAVDAAADAEETFDRFRTWVRRAARSLAGNRAPLARVPNADPECQGVMEACAAALELAEVRQVLLAEDYLKLSLGRVAIMPIGSVSAPFWLNERSRSLAVYVRTRERDDAHGKPSYNFHVMPLEAEAFDALRTKAREGARRLRVDRVAVLLADDDGFFAGRNLMLYTLDDWIHVVRRGLLTGSQEAASTTAAIQARFAPVGLLRHETDVVAPAHALGQRTVDWIDRVREWSFEATAFEIQPWVRRVRAVAAEIASPAGDGATRHAWTQLAELLPQPLVERLRQTGFDSLRDIDPSWLGEVIAGFDATGRDRAESAWLDAHASQLADALGTALFTRDDAGRWDVAAPLNSER